MQKQKNNQSGKETNFNESHQPLNEREAAKVLGISVQTLRNWRHLRKPPAYLKISRRVLYQIEDLIEFKNSCKVEL